MYHIITDFPAETSGVKNPLVAEYFLIHVNEFNKVAVTTLEEWVACLKFSALLILFPLNLLQITRNSPTFAEPTIKA